jgi:hypothetical protein
MAFKLVRGVEAGNTIYPPGPRVRRHRNGAFVTMGREQVVAIAKALDSPRLTVAWMVLYEHWANKGKPFPMSNIKLTACGVDRWVKARALANLEAAGLISIGRKPGRAPMISWKGPAL